jgi:hypothetical protein
MSVDGFVLVQYRTNSPYPTIIGSTVHNDVDVAEREATERRKDAVAARVLAGPGRPRVGSRPRPVPRRRARRGDHDRARHRADHMTVEPDAWDDCGACGHDREEHFQGGCDVEMRDFDGDVVDCPCVGFVEEEDA